MNIKHFFYTIISIIILTFFVGYGWFRVQSSYEPEPQDIEQIFAAQEFFLHTHQPIITIDLAYIYPTISHIDLLKPKDDLTRTAWDQSESVAYSSDQCGESSKLKGMFLSQFKKEEIWEQYRCGIIKVLPNSFFQIPPFIHPTGNSYAYIAYRFNEVFREKSWVIENIMLFHITELREIEDKIGKLPSIFHFLAMMDETTLSYVEHKVDPVLIDKYVLFPKQNALSLLNHEYDVFLKEQLEDFLASTPYNISLVRRGKLCFYSQGQLCWNIAPTQLWKHISLRTILVVFFLLIIIGVLIWLLFHYLKIALVEDDRRKLALQILGHELRTPIASMVLQIDGLTRSIDKYDEETQDLIWGLSINTQRLRRLVEMTRSYLLLGSKKKNLQIKANVIDSVNEYFAEICDEFPETQFHPLEQDRSFKTDAHWLAICVKNILSNAHTHGKSPIELFLKFDIKGQLEIIIRDQGTCEYKTLEEMCQEFVKGKQSHGTGLGLNIVLKVLKAIHGELSFQSKPTTFTMRIKEGVYD